MLKITATWKKNMFQFNTVEWVGSRQPPPHHEPLMLLRGRDGGQPESSRTGGQTWMYRHGNGASSPGSSHSGNGPTGPSWGGPGWPRHRAARAHPWAS